ncbi:MAG: hypothetical protein PHV04_02485 [Clostridia bacterium]|nr:hypothetical protein [Clostridia bacterium]
MTCVIFGAGKIARGFIAHLLYLSGIRFVFVEKNQALVELINQKKRYCINVMGNSDKNICIDNVSALGYIQENEIVELILDSDAIFTAVGGKNLIDTASIIAKGICKKIDKKEKLNIITCENWKQPALCLKNEILKYLSDNYLKEFDLYIGITEAVVMRSAIEPDKCSLIEDPLLVNVQNFWELPVNASDMVSGFPNILGVRAISSFEGFLEKKFYTYNAANATVSYLGALLGYKVLSKAAKDERVIKVLDGVYSETSSALCKKYGFSNEEQKEFVKGSKMKLQDETITDYIERNARDPIRKLSCDDRLIGPARMAIEYDILPCNLCIAIAAAIYYENAEDESSNTLKKMREIQGVDTVLDRVCKIDINGILGKLIKYKIELLKLKGWINE